MHLGFSYVGLIYLLMLFIPNIIWVKHKPKDYEKYAGRENEVFLVLERIGQVAVTCLVLIFSDFNVHGNFAWFQWLVMAFVLMVLYEIWWIRYFRSEKTMKDFYSSIL